MLEAVSSRARQLERVGTTHLARGACGPGWAGEHRNRTHLEMWQASDEAPIQKNAVRQNVRSTYVDFRPAAPYTCYRLYERHGVSLVLKHPACVL